MTGSTLNLMISPMARTIAMAVWRATMGVLLRSELRDARTTISGRVLPAVQNDSRRFLEDRQV